MEKTKIQILVIATTLIFVSGLSATWLLGPEGFESRVIINHSGSPVTQWFAPTSHTPLYVYSPGFESDSAVGSGAMSWPAWWGNFIRTPRLDCSTADSTILVFRMWNTANSYDFARFYAWIDAAYCSTTTLTMTVARDWEEISIDFTRFAAGHSQVYFYLEGNFGSDSYTHEVKFDDIGVRTGIPLNIKESALPSDFDMTIFPNPFNSAVEIRIQNTEDRSQKAGDRIQEIEIYDIAGKRVAGFVGAGLKPARAGGSETLPYEIVWTPTPSVPSGVYLVRAKIGKSETTKRVVYLK